MIKQQNWPLKIKQAYIFRINESFIELTLSHALKEILLTLVKLFFFSHQVFDLLNIQTKPKRPKSKYNENQQKNPQTKRLQT